MVLKAYFLGQAWMPDHKTCTHSQKETQNIYSLLAQWGKQYYEKKINLVTQI